MKTESRRNVAEGDQGKGLILDQVSRKEKDGAF